MRFTCVAPGHYRVTREDDDPYTAGFVVRIGKLWVFSNARVRLTAPSFAALKDRVGEAFRTNAV